MKKTIPYLLAFCTASNVYAGDFSYEVHGNTDTLYGYSDVSERYESKDNNNSVNNSSALNFSAEYEFDNGSRTGLYLDVEAGFNKTNEEYNNGSWGKEVYGSFDSRYGRVMVGETYNAAYQFGKTAPRVGALGTNNSNIVDFIENPNWQRKHNRIGYKTLNSTLINTDGVAPKITYITPEFKGTYVGFSYVPDTQNRRGLESHYNHYDNNDGYIGSLYNEYDLGFADMSTSLGYAQFHDDDREFSAGISLSRGGWTLASSFRKAYIDGSKEFINADLSDNYREGRAWDVGLSYEIGPFATGLSYFESKADNTDNRDRMVIFSNKYQVNKWANVYLAAAHVEFEGESKDIGNNNKGYSFITGVGLEF